MAKRQKLSKLSDLATRTTKTVKTSKKTYKYRYKETNRRTRTTAGYAIEDKSQRKLNFKNGKLTALGKEFRDSLDPATQREFDKYVKEHAEEGVSLARFASHLQSDRDERFLYNLNVDRDTLIEDIKETVDYQNRINAFNSINGTNYTINDYEVWKLFVEFDYEYGYRIK